ncbi:MAG: tyrosine-type recombinase/integrase [Pseudomonadota bacterium]
MPADKPKLTDLVLKKRSLPVGRHNDTPALYVEIRGGGTTNFLFMRYLRIPGGRKRVTMGIGGYPGVSLAAARQKAAYLYELTQQDEVVVRVGRGEKFADIAREIESRDALAKFSALEAERNRHEHIFAAYAETFIASTVEKQNSNRKAVQQWRSTLRDYCQPLMDMNVNDITIRDVYGCLEPIWFIKNPTATKVQQRIHRILGAAHALGIRSTPSPAAYRGNLENLLPSMKQVQNHHAAMSYVDAPAYYELLKQRAPSVANYALRFIMLTALRLNEAVAARWSDIDLEKALYTVPATRMGKTKKPHLVPLTSECMAILEALKPHAASDYVFKPETSALQVTEAALRKLMGKTGAGQYSRHGFRSTFKDWSMDVGGFPHELSEEQLSHQLPAVQKAYRRGQAIEKRREMMQAWFDYLASTSDDD